jgi:hypothetical protein
MVLITSLLTGLFAAMLRSLFAVITVAFLISLTFLGSFLFYGASVVGLVIAILGFNAGLIVFIGAHVLRSGQRSAQ